MTTAELLIDAFGRIREDVHGAVQDLTPEQLAVRLDEQANSIAWLVWHLTRVQDDHIADAAQIEQVWTSSGWTERFALPFDASDTGYGHDATDVAAVTVDSGRLLTEYHDAVHDQTIRFVDGITDADLDRIVDERWDPLVSLGVRIVSVINDNTEHAGQAAFVRGIVLRG
ncbi:MAG TPA: DUF664 domain-containing protein [Acidimicrobiia bacterium]|nr:DUF664 domain-containing protein [Acidimicrobiia bacterium]